MMVDATSFDRGGRPAGGQEPDSPELAIDYALFQTDDRHMDHTPAADAVRLAEEFLTRVWGPSHDLSAIDELMTDDYAIDSAGHVVRGRDAFKAWVAEFHRRLEGARNEVLETFATADGRRVVSRWLCTGRNNGVFGLSADHRVVAFTGIAIWTVRDGRLSECIVERSAFEAFRSLTQQSSQGE
jgi:ketosteroid isomerase-like protein